MLHGGLTEIYLMKKSYSSDGERWARIAQKYLPLVNLGFDCGSLSGFIFLIGGISGRLTKKSCWDCLVHLTEVRMTLFLCRIISSFVIIFSSFFITTKILDRSLLRKGSKLLLIYCMMVLVVYFTCWVRQLVIFVGAKFQCNYGACGRQFCLCGHLKGNLWWVVHLCWTLKLNFSHNDLIFVIIIYFASFV